MNKEQDIFSKLVEKAKLNKLTEREQRAMFLAVDTYVENNPIFIKEKASENAMPNKSKFAPLQSQKSNRPVPSPYMADKFQAFISSWHIHSFKTVIAVFVIMIFGVGGSSLAAQNSLPGNFLYPIKVNINEGIKTALLSGPARAAYEVERVKTRIEEAKKLVVQNKMTDEIQGQIATRLSRHVSNVQKDVDTLSKNGDLKVAFEISSDLENSLVASKVATAELPHEDVSDQELASIQEIIDVPLEASAVVRENAEDQIATLQKNDEDTKVIAIAKLESAKKLIQSIDESAVTLSGATATDVDVSVSTASGPAVSSPASSLMKAKATTAIGTTTPNPETENLDPLADARDLLVQGEEKLDMGDYDAAFSLFKEAYDTAQNLQIKTELENEIIEQESEDVLNNTVIEVDPETINVSESINQKNKTKKVENTDYLGEVH